jgi:hypothetical protein
MKIKLDADDKRVDGEPGDRGTGRRLHEKTSIRSRCRERELSPGAALYYERTGGASTTLSVPAAKPFLKQQL